MTAGTKGSLGLLEPLSSKQGFHEARAQLPEEGHWLVLRVLMGCHEIGAEIAKGKLETSCLESVPTAGAISSVTLTENTCKQGGAIPSSPLPASQSPVDKT